MTTVKTVKDLDVSKITFSDLMDSDKVISQRISFIKYADEKKLSLQTPVLMTETYGIPRESHFYPDDKSRSFYKLPFCHDRKKYDDELDYKEIKLFHDKLVQIDKLCGSDAFRRKLFGDKLDKYQYSPLVRQNQDDEEGVKVDKNGNPYYRPEYAKIKIMLHYTTSKPLISLFENNDGVRKPVDVNSLSDVVDHLKYLSKLRFILNFSKLYVMKTSSGNAKRMFGINLVATHAEVFVKARNNRLSDISFIDDEEEPISNTRERITRKNESPLWKFTLLLN